MAPAFLCHCEICTDNSVAARIFPCVVLAACSGRSAPKAFTYCESVEPYSKAHKTRRASGRDSLKTLTRQSDLCIWSALTEKPMSLKRRGQGY